MIPGIIKTSGIKWDDMKYLIKFFQIGVSVFLIWILFTKLDLIKIKEILLSANIFYVFLFIAVYPLSVWISTNRWQVVLNRKKIKIPFWELYKSYWIGSFYNNFFHEIGGDFYKSYQLSKRYKIPLKDLYLTTFVERISGFICILILSLIFCFPTIFLLLKQFNYTNQILIILFFILISIGILIKFYKQVKEKLKKIKLFFDKITILKLTLWCLFFVAEGLFAYYFIFYALGFELTMLDLISSVPVIQLAGVIPLTPNALGVTEGVAVLFLNPKGLPIEVIITGMILIRSLLFLANALGALIFQVLPRSDAK